MKRRISKNVAVFVAIAFQCYANIKKRICASVYMYIEIPYRT